MHSKRATKRACRQIRELAPDVVHLHNLHNNYIHLPTLFAFLAKEQIPTLITLHDCWFFTGHCVYYKNNGNCQGWLHGCADCPAVGAQAEKGYLLREKWAQNMAYLAVNGVSEWTAEDARRSVLKEAKWIECIYNWIDTDVFRPKTNAEEIKQKYGVAPDRKMVLSVAQVWSNNKGLDSMVALADQLAEVADVILVGQNNGIPERSNLRCIGFTANVNELVDLYSAADVYANASGAETFGLVTAEAMACGTPVVAFNNSGSSEIVVRECGMLVEDGNRRALADGVKEILAQGKDLYTAACREHVCKHFDKHAQTHKYVEFYEKIMLAKSPNRIKEKE